MPKAQPKTRPLRLPAEGFPAIDNVEAKLLSILAPMQRLDGMSGPTFEQRVRDFFEGVLTSFADDVATAQQLEPRAREALGRHAPQLLPRGD